MCIVLLLLYTRYIKMLFGIIGTIDRGNFVFDSWPRNKNYPLIKGSISAGELSDKISEYFYYCTELITKLAYIVKV